MTTITAVFSAITERWHPVRQHLQGSGTASVVGGKELIGYHGYPTEQAAIEAGLKHLKKPPASQP